jgi:hypothetical protein
MATATILKDGPAIGLSAKRCRRIVGQLPKLLCTPGSITGLRPRDEGTILGVAFVSACVDIGATGLIGQALPWYEPLRADILKIVEELPQDDKENKSEEASQG